MRREYSGFPSLIVPLVYFGMSVVSTYLSSLSRRIFESMGLMTPRLMISFRFKHHRGRLILTYILQTDFVKRPLKPMNIAECFTTSAISIRSTSGPKKMWVRISLKRAGLSGPFSVMSLALREPLGSIYMSTVYPSF